MYLVLVEAAFAAKFSSDIFTQNLCCRSRRLWLQNLIPVCNSRNQPGSVRGPAAGAGPGHALRGRVQREAGEGRHQGGRAHQAAPQGEQKIQKQTWTMLFKVNLLLIKLTSREVINMYHKNKFVCFFSLILSANCWVLGAAPSSSCRRAR